MYRAGREAFEEARRSPTVVHLHEWRKQTKYLWHELEMLHPIRPAHEQERCLKALIRFSVRPRDPERIIATLSGGNQQKVIVARWMEAGCRLLVLEEPTFGVDVGSKAEIYQLLEEALDQGLAVLLISSDFEEVAGICHRALIFDRGRVTAELPRSDLSLARLTALASGAEEGKIRARLA